MHHRRTQKRRLFAGRLETSYRREERLRRLQEGKKPRKRRQIAGKPNASYNKELRLMGFNQYGRKLPERSKFARMKGEFRGYNRDPRIKRK